MTETAHAIPYDVASRLCEEIRAEQRGKWYRWTAWWCWGCERFTQGDPAKMCFANDPQNRGCAQVNARYEGEEQSGTTDKHR
jgi:hypothetical protein